MIKGTTPTHIFTLPVDAETIKTIRIIYAQGGIERVTKGNEHCSLDGNRVECRLTQEDTFTFQEGECVEVQVRVLLNTGEALASQVMRVHCRECLSDEVLA